MASRAQSIIRNLLKTPYLSTINKIRMKNFGLLLTPKVELIVSTFCKNTQVGDKNVAGLSTIASPILGSPHLDSKLFSAVKYIQKFSPDEFSSYILKNKDIFKKTSWRLLLKIIKSNGLEIIITYSRTIVFTQA